MESARSGSRTGRVVPSDCLEADKIAATAPLDKIVKTHPLTSAAEAPWRGSTSEFKFDQSAGASWVVFHRT